MKNNKARTPYKLTKTPLKSVVREEKTRQKWLKKRSLHNVNEHFEAIFNAVFSSAIAFQKSSRSAYALTALLLTSNSFAEPVINGAFERELSPTPESWSVYLDNDLFSSRSTDRDYTGGLAFIYSSPKVADFVFSPSRILDGIHKITGHRQSETHRYTLHSFEAGLTAFTPEDINIAQPIQGDRPYASLAYISGTQQIIEPEKHIAWVETLTVGALGTDIPAEFQNAVHSLTSSVEAQGWDNQISEGGEATFRYSLSRQKHHIHPSPKLGLTTTLQVSAGYITEVSYGGSLRWGRIRSPWWSFNPNQNQYAEKAQPEDPLWGQPDELYLWAGVNAKLRAYNAFLQGQFRDSAVSFDSDDLNPLLLEAWLGVTRSFRNGYRISYVLRTQSSEIKEGPADRAQVWGGFIIGRTF